MKGSVTEMKEKLVKMLAEFKRVPESEIKGSVGRSEAFAAGTLYGIYNGFDDEEILRFATLAAACSLFAENSTDGMLSKNEIYALEQKYGRKDF